MSRVKEKPRYYIVRAEVVWGIILGVVILFIVVLCGKNCTESIKETAMEQENRRESVNVTWNRSCLIQDNVIYVVIAGEV